MFIGGCSTFLLLSIVHFWYGMSRYPSIWNRFVPTSIKGATVDRNFKEIKDICGFHHNGHYRMNSQVIPFVMTLPFTILFHTIAFLVTTIYYLPRKLLKLLKMDEVERKLPDPVITSIFLSNALVTSLWILGGTVGMVFATLTIFFNQKAYNSLLFKKNFKDFCLSLVFGNFLVVEKLPTGATEIALCEKSAEGDLEEGTQKASTELMADEGLQSSRASLPPIRYLPPLLGASSSSPTNSFDDKEMAIPENYSTAASQRYSSMTNDKIVVIQNGEEQVATNYYKESPMDIFVDETASLHSIDALQHIVTVKPTPENIEIDTGPEIEKCDQPNKGDIDEIKTEKLGHSKKTSKKRIFGLSRRMFSSPRNKQNRKKEDTTKDHFENDLPVEFLNPTDVHVDMESHPGTVEWKITISESIQRFKIKSYTLRKHNWVMSKMHGKSFFTKGYGHRRRKLKRKEIKEHCKGFHDKQLHVNTQLFGILDDLKDSKKNISHSKSNSITYSKSNSEHTKFSFTNLPSSVKGKTKTFRNVMSMGAQSRKRDEYYTMSDANYQTSKSGGASTGKESLSESKDSSISTLTQSIYPPEQLDDTRSGLCINGLTGQPNEDSSSFKDTINGILKCAPWIDNINSLKETASIEETDCEQNELTSRQPPPGKIDASKSSEERPFDSSENILKINTGNPEGGCHITQEPYWQNCVVLPEIFQQKLQGEKYPWRSDLQKKKIEKAQDDRSQSKEIAVKETKRIIPILKKKKDETDSNEVLEGKLIDSSPKPKTTDEDENRDQPCGDDGLEMAGNGRYDVDDQRLIESFDHRGRRINLTGSPEINTSPNHSVLKKISGIDFGRECGAFDGVTDACSPFTATEQREDEDFLYGVKLDSTDRIF